MSRWIRFDLRTAPFGESTERLCGAAIEIAAWADSAGFEAVLLPEHHGRRDGYNPSPAVLAAGIATRTASLRLHLGAVILPLHNIIRVAEDIALLDNLSGGRVELTVGGGYAADEFEMFGRSLAHRASLLDDGLAALIHAFSGEPFEYEGRRVQVLPRPVQQPRPPIYVGGGVRASARRAARFGDGYFPATEPGPEIWDTYAVTCRELGRPVGRRLLLGGPRFVHVSEDPERDWHQVKPFAVFEASAYGSAGADDAWNRAARAMEQSQSPPSDGLYRVVTPAECVDVIRQTEAAGRIFAMTPLMGGIDPDFTLSSLNLFATDVLPHLRCANAAPPSSIGIDEVRARTQA